VLRATWLAVIELLGTENLVIGDKSMGGQIASMVADEAGGFPHEIRRIDEVPSPLLDFLCRKNGNRR